MEIKEVTHFYYFDILLVSIVTNKWPMSCPIIMGYYPIQIEPLRPCLPIIQSYLTTSSSICPKRNVDSIHGNLETHIIDPKLDMQHMLNCRNHLEIGRKIKFLCRSMANPYVLSCESEYELGCSSSKWWFNINDPKWANSFNILSKVLFPK